MPAPTDYLERVYAGVLGKIIGVYLGRPFEGWTYQRISSELAEIWDYVLERFGVLVAAMEAQAFIEHRIDQLIEAGLRYLPPDSLITQLVNDIRDWHRTDGDWRMTRERIEQKYGYDKFPGNCHVIPNHAVIILSLLYSEDEFSRALMIANTAGWDTDCNSGNVGCLLGIKNGLSAIDPKLRTPVADRLYLSTADGGRCITDAVRETYEICRIAHKLGQAPAVAAPKNGGRFHFTLPGSVQGFQVEPRDGTALVLRSPGEGGLVLRSFSEGGNVSTDNRTLTLDFKFLPGDEPVRISTPTFIPPDSKDASHYCLMACPTLYPGNIVRGRLIAGAENSAPVRVAPFVTYYGANDELYYHHGPALTFDPNTAQDLQWQIEDLTGAPIAQFGLEVSSDNAASGWLHIDSVDWSGTPTTVFRRPDNNGKMWLRAWINPVDHVGTRWASAFHLSQNRGTGLFIQGSRDWQNYSVRSAILSDPAKSFGLAARVQGLTRYYALLLSPNQVLRLIRSYDRTETLAEVPYNWTWSERYHFKLEVTGTKVIGSLNGTELIRYDDDKSALLDGGIALVCEEGLIMTDEVKVIAA